MNIEAERIENAIESLREAIKAHDLVTEIAHFHLSQETFHEAHKNEKELSAKAIEALNAVPPAGNGVYPYWNYRAYFLVETRQNIEKKNETPKSMLHVCIHEVAKGTFKRPNPPQEPGEFSFFFAEPSQDEKDEYDFRCKFSDWYEKVLDWRRWDAMP